MNERLIDFDDYADVKLTEYIFRLDRVPGNCIGIIGGKYTWMTEAEMVRSQIYPPLREYIDILVALNPARRSLPAGAFGRALAPDANTDFILALLKKHTEEARELLELQLEKEKND